MYCLSSTSKYADTDKRTTRWVKPKDAAGAPLCGEIKQFPGRHGVSTPHHNDIERNSGLSQTHMPHSPPEDKRQYNSSWKPVLPRLNCEVGTSSSRPRRVREMRNLAKSNMSRRALLKRRSESHAWRADMRAYLWQRLLVAAASIFLLVGSFKCDLAAASGEGTKGEGQNKVSVFNVQPSLQFEHLQLRPGTAPNQWKYNTVCESSNRLEITGRGVARLT